MPMLALLFVIVLFVHPASAADSYSASAFMDWGSLSFSGISVTYGPRESPFVDQLQGASIFAPTREDLKDPAFISGWPDKSFTANLPETGIATSIADASKLEAILNLHGIGSGTAQAARTGQVTALQAGTLTISIPYRFSQSGNLAALSILSSEFSLRSSAGVSFLQADFSKASGNVLQQGVWSVTQSFAVGETGSFQALSMLNAHVTSVPEPDLFVPCLVVLLTLFSLSATRRFE